MEPIHVPKPPRQAFNKHRRLSDLIRAQVNHFKHLEAKMTEEERETLPQHAITTEEDAALYIAAITRRLLGQAPASAPGPVAVSNVRQPIPIRSQGIALAASGATHLELELGSEKPYPGGNGHAPEATK